MHKGIWVCLVVVAWSCSAEKWQWPKQSASVRIDTKVRFVDAPEAKPVRSGRLQAQADEEPAPFLPAAETTGFYNRAGGGGRYPVRAEIHRADPGLHRAFHPLQPPRAWHINHQLEGGDEESGTLDSLQYCKCVSTPECNPRDDSARACGSGQFLCCYKRPNKGSLLNSEFFNELDDERASLLPGRDSFARPFPPPPPSATQLNSDFDRGQGGQQVLVGPLGATGHVGPWGPRGPVSNQGPTSQLSSLGPNSHPRPNVLVGPSGPTGIIGPNGLNEKQNQNQNVLVGPGGPTGIIGPASVIGNKGSLQDIGPSESAQRGILVGPGGPTGVIGPRTFNRRPVLVGPGGPTGIIGPRMQPFFNQFFERETQPGVLVGPRGPSGMIGQGRRVLVGPGGPTGIIGPQNYFR